MFAFEAELSETGETENTKLDCCPSRCVVRGRRHFFFSRSFTLPIRDEIHDKYTEHNQGFYNIHCPRKVH